MVESMLKENHFVYKIYFKKILFFKEKLERVDLLLSATGTLRITFFLLLFQIL